MVEYFMLSKNNVRFTPDSTRCADIPDRQLDAKSRRLRGHSITPSARNTIDGGTVRARALAVLAFSTVTVSIGKFPSQGS
jgi:hypothetical protein